MSNVLYTISVLCITRSTQCLLGQIKTELSDAKIWILKKIKSTVNSNMSHHLYAMYMPS